MELSTVLLDEIKRTALAIAPDYPQIESVPPREQLWAIQQSCKGLEMANQDLHDIVRWLAKKEGIEPGSEAYMSWLDSTLRDARVDILRSES
jgi:hypothetical protein